MVLASSSIVLKTAPLQINPYALVLACMQNVLHWHIVDMQSFPLEIPSYPKLWNGAYSVSERYTMADAAEIVRQVISAWLAPCILFWLSFL